jgi:alpha-tubulin suppressor-like RCC1 family protein
MGRRALAAVTLGLAALVVGASAVACNALLGIQGGHPRLTVKQLSAGTAFACALLSDGSVWCWGANDYGQLGHYDLDADQPCKTPLPDGGERVELCAPRPTQVNQIAGATQIAVGGNFACALVASGSVLCWGADDSDQIIGARSSTDFYTRCPEDFFDAGTAQQIPCDPIPQQVPLPGPASAIAAGTMHACAIVSGKVSCWGTVGNDVLGTMVMTAPDQNGAGPVVADGVEGATQISASILTGGLNDHTCVVTSGGKAECWGTNGSYQLGCNNNGPNPNVLCEIPLTSGVTSIAAGGLSTCALGPASAMNCWGSDSFYTFGNPDMSYEAYMPTPSDYAQVLGEVDASASFFEGRSLHILMVDTAGGLWGWGDNTYGELAREPGAQNCSYQQADSCLTTPMGIELDGGGVEVIATGIDFSVAYTSDGTLWAWGANGEGQLGFVSDGGPCPERTAGEVPCAWVPTPVTFPAISN